MFALPIIASATAGTAPTEKEIAASGESPAELRREMSDVTIEVTVVRQNGPDDAPYNEVFLIPYRPRMNVISVLMEIQKDSTNREGKTVAPVAWEQACLEEVCGSCTMRINGKVRQSCSALIDKVAPLTGKTRKLHLAPMSKFPVVRDLCVDRSKMFENLAKIQGWIPIDGTYDLGPGPRMSQQQQQLAYDFSRCMTCGSCLEACPQVNEKNNFIGPAAIGQVRLFNSHPTGKLNADERLEAVSGPTASPRAATRKTAFKSAPKKSRSRAPSPNCTATRRSIASKNGWPLTTLPTKTEKPPIKGGFEGGFFALFWSIFSVRSLCSQRRWNDDRVSH